MREIREVDAAYPPTHLPTPPTHPTYSPHLPTYPPTQVDAAEAGGRRSGLASRTLPRGALRHFKFKLQQPRGYALVWSSSALGGGDGDGGGPPLTLTLTLSLSLSPSPTPKPKPNP